MTTDSHGNRYILIHNSSFQLWTANHNRSFRLEKDGFPPMEWEDTPESWDGIPEGAATGFMRELMTKVEAAMPYEDVLNGIWKAAGGV